MIITRTPFRVTLGGGGTDLPAYYEKHGGFIFSAGLDKYMFVTVNRPMEDDLVRIKYSETEVAKKVKDIRHPIAREALTMMGIEKQIEISSVADISAGTGLGSSSCYAVGILHALHVMKRDYVPLQTIAEEDFLLENKKLGRPIGKQDPYMAAFGGLTVLDIDKNGTVKVRKANVSQEAADTLNQNMLMFFTGVTRSADDILKKQSKAFKENKKEASESMHFIKEIGEEILVAMEDDEVDEVGKLFDAHWQHKKKTASGMSNPKFDAMYESAKDAGALGGKISGAGGGGFFTFYVPGKHKEFRRAMRKYGLREMHYRFDFEGSKVLADISQSL
ncbi:galactokinase [Candidatus Kaiserbacteria bacterium RIFCSPHIGHO2_01_FULL_56_24]|uniref:Galactokinase n=1 Tax=Candidatus Kaiserbacteria bacterium RIFCSPHIGHO2_01_FULL_56_24 TaxID=1798487 RepID=A0A1F6DBR1_9BACT|nr:MAG: galactokinase [Candidatus Kaiserbacteria bacterium RIFCSPHIGHO2_01_FULL_56_24]